MLRGRASRRSFLGAAVRASAVALIPGQYLAGRALAQGSGAPLVLRSGGGWLRIDRGVDGLELSAGRGDTDGPPVVAAGWLELWDGVDPRVLPLVDLAPTPDGTGAILGGGDDGDWTVQVMIAPEQPLDGLFRCQVKLTYGGEAPRVSIARLRWRVAGPRADSWMVPGAFYGNGPPDGYRGHPYPRLQAGAQDLDGLVADHWSFRADRASHPAVLAWSPRGCAGLATDPAYGDDLAGLAFGVDGARPSDASWLGLSFPWDEGPRRYTLSGPARWGSPAAVAARMAQPGEGIAITTWLYLAEPDPYAFDPLLRWLYARLAPGAPLRPWFGAERAAALASEGMTRWHAARPLRMLWESVAFAAYQPGHALGERRLEHVGWVDGVPTALALARYARTVGDGPSEQLALGVIDRIATEAPTSHGIFWAAWSPEAGWGGGWSPVPGWIQARTVAEATQSLLVAAAEEKALGRPRAKWEQAAAANLEFALGAQRADGNFGSYYDGRSGEVVDRKGSAGLRWVPTLVEGWRRVGDPRYLDAARRGGTYYAAAVEEASLYGAPEDADLTPSSEDGYVALRAYRALAAAEPPGSPQAARWSALARKSASWLLTFRFAWNVPFGSETLLGTLGFATRGGDVASPRNQHIHAYGLVSVEDLLGLWQETGDRYYLDRARDALLCFWQTIARSDGDFGAGTGMMTEQWYHVDWTAPKGGMLPLAHVWPLGMVLQGWWAARQFGNLVVEGRQRYAVLLAPGSASVRSDAAGPLAIDVSNPMGEPQSVRARVVSLDICGATVDGAPTPVERSGGVGFISFAAPPGGTRRLVVTGS